MLDLNFALHTILEKGSLGMGLTNVVCIPNTQGSDTQ